MLPKVSIIIPCYNNEKSISATLDSIINQSFLNWEAIIIDDCSEDKSLEIIKQYCKRDVRLKFFQTMSSSGSPSLPRNIGLKFSIGKYIAFLDSDDIWLPSKLEEQVCFIEVNRYDFIYSNYEKISFDGIRNNRIIKVKKRVIYKDLLKSCDIPCLTVLIKKNIIENIYFKNKPKEDYLYWLTILKTGVTAHNTNKVHALYRESSLSRSSNKIQMIKNQWYIIRKHERLSLIKSSIYILIYGFKGLNKYLR